MPKFLRQSYRRSKWAGDSDKIKKIQEKLPDIFGQVSETEPSPCKILLFVFPQSGAKIRANENFAPPKAQGSRMPLVRAVYHDLLRRVAARSNQGRNDEWQGAQFPGRRITMRAPNDCGTPKSPSNITRTSVQYICFRKTSGSNIGSPNLLLAPGAIERRCAPNSNSILLCVARVYETRSYTVAYLRRS